MPKDAANTLAKSALEAIRQTDARGAQKVYNQLLNNNLVQQLENLQANTVKSLQEDFAGAQRQSENQKCRFCGKSTAGSPVNNVCKSCLEKRNNSPEAKHQSNTNSSDRIRGEKK